MDRVLMQDALDAVDNVSAIANDAYRHLPADRQGQLARLPQVADRLLYDANSACFQDNQEMMAGAVLAAEALCHLLPAISDQGCLIEKARNELNHLAGRLVGVFGEPGQ